MATDVTPAIRRAWTSTDSEVTIEHVAHKDTKYERGIGDYGKKVEHVAHECPCCGHDEMIRLHHVNPVDRDGASYWCLMPNCRYFVADELSWATKPHPQYKPETPMVWDQTHVCIECEGRSTKTVTKAEYAAKRVEDGIVKHVCDKCIETEVHA